MKACKSLIDFKKILGFIQKVIRVFCEYCGKRSENSDKSNQNLEKLEKFGVFQNFSLNFRQIDK